MVTTQFDPNIANVFDRMATALDVANEKAASSERLLAAMAAHAGAIADETDDATKKMREFFKVSDNIEDNYKKIVDYAKKRGNLSKKDLDDAKKARKELTTLAQLHKDALATAKKETKETEAMRRNLAMIEKVMKSMKHEGQLVGKEWQEVADIFDAASRNAKSLATAVAQLGRSGTALKGIAGVLGAAGVGKGFNSKLERRLEQQQEIKAKIAEAREARQVATRKHMDKKRENAVAETKKKSKQWGYGDLVDADTGEVTTDAGRDYMARKMGFKRGSQKYTDFITGEKAGGAAGGSAAGGAEGAAWAGAMSEGGGAIEMLATVVEEGVGALGALAPELSILIGVIELLIEVFDGYAKQNQEIEKNLGKGGLFTGAQGAGEAFANARKAINPNFGVGVPLGVTMERNMALAGAMVQGGYNVNQSFMPNAANTANQGPGAMGEFMKGGVGEIQRIVMGAGRVGGMTDQEGVEEVLKLLDKYRETMASSEMFLTRVNKDTQAAGISTIKYLKIIDDVSGSFDKMGKSLEQVTGVMRELSRYGAVSSESLKDMMEFLEAGQQKTNMSNVQTAAFTQAIMNPETLKSLRETEKTTLQNYVENLNAERPSGMSALDISGAIKSGDYGKAQGLANSMRTQISGITDPTVKQSMTQSLNKIQDQINRVSGVMSPDFLKRASSQGLYKEDSAQTIANLFTNLQKSAQYSGTSMKQVMSGGGSAEQQIMVQQLSEMLGVKAGNYANAFDMMRNEATNRIMDVQTAQGGPAQQKANAKQLFSELYRGAKMKDGIPTFLTEKGLGKYMKGNMDDTFDAIYDQGKGVDKLVDLFGYNTDQIASDQETQNKILKANADGAKTDKDSLAAQLSQARGMAMRTQTVEDLLKNTFKPLLTDLLSAVETIATWIAKHFGGDFAKDQAQTAKDMAAIPDKINELGDRAEQLAKDPATQKQAQAMLEQMKFLQGIQEHGTFLSGSEQAKAESLLGTATLSKANLRMATAGGIGGEAGLAAQAATYVYNMYDAHYNHDTANDGSVGNASQEHPAQQKGNSADMKPSGSK